MLVTVFSSPPQASLQTKGFGLGLVVSTPLKLLVRFDLPLHELVLRFGSKDKFLPFQYM